MHTNSCMTKVALVHLVLPAKKETQRAASITSSSAAMLPRWVVGQTPTLGGVSRFIWEIHKLGINTRMALTIRCASLTPWDSAEGATSSLEMS
jgi:hypothetical protein